MFTRFVALALLVTPMLPALRAQMAPRAAADPGMEAAEAAPTAQRCCCCPMAACKCGCAAPAMTGEREPAPKPRKSVSCACAPQPLVPPDARSALPKLCEFTSATLPLIEEGAPAARVHRWVVVRAHGPPPEGEALSNIILLN